MSEYTPKYPTHEGDDSNKSSSELLAETLKPIYVPQELMLAWESHLASYSRDTSVLLDQVKESEAALNTQYQALLARVQKYEQMLQDITMDSNEFHMDSDQENFTGWNILAQASYWDYLLKKEITKLSDKINGIGSRGDLVSDVSNEILEGLIADNNYISNVIEALSDTPLIRELADALNTTTTSLSDLQEEYVKLAQKQVADAEALANQQVEKAEQLVEAINASIAEQLDRIAEEAAIRTQLLQELEDKVNDASAQAAADVGELITQVDSIRDGAAADKASILETVNNYKTELKSDIANVNTELLGALDGVHTLVSEVRDENGVTLNELNTYKASNDVALAGVLSKVTTNISDTAANASKITGLTSELATVNTELGTVRNTAANALSKADTAVTANSALAIRVDALAASITDLGDGDETSVDVHAFNALKAEVETNAAGVTSLVEQVDALGTNYTNLTDGVEANTDAVSKLTVKQSEMNGDISQLASDVTFLTSELGVIDTALNTKASNQALNNLTTKLNTTDGKVAANTQQLTQLNTDFATVRDGLETKASTEALNNLATEVTELEDGIAVNASAITDLRSEIDTELGKKATVTAVNGLTTKVEEVEGKTTTNANNILALNNTVGNVVNGLATKLDSSAISDYYTKSQTDDKAAEIAAGKVEEFSASLSIGGVNQLLNSEEERSSKATAKREYLLYERSEHLKQFYDDNLEKDVTISFEIMVPVTGAIQVYSSNNSAHSYSAITPSLTADEWTKVSVTVKPKRHSNYDVYSVSTLEFYGTYDTGRIPHVRKVQLEAGNVATDWSPSPRDTQAALDANSTAIQNTVAEVERVDGLVTATNSAQTLLEGRVGKVEGGLAKKADASALSSLDTRVGTVEGQYTSQASDITKLTNSLDTTNVNVSTAQTAAQNAMNAAGAKGKVIFGSSTPAVADRLSQNLWIDTTGNANTPKRWNGSAWVAVTDKVATDAAKAASDLNNIVKTKADVSALNSLTTKVTEEADKIAANTSSITTLNSDIVKINNNLATKANASALSDMYTKSQADDKATEIAAGEVSKYDASLVIGGSNLIPDSYKSFRVGSVSQSQLVRTILSDGSLQITNSGSLTSSYLANFQSAKTTFTELIGALQNGEEFTVTLWFKAVDTSKLPTANPTLHIATDLSYLALNGDRAALVSGKEVPYSYTRKWVGTITAVSPHLTFTPASLGGGLILTKWKIEKGNKSTDWTEASQDIQEQLDANATAIQTTNAEVEKVDGKTITNANNITKLNSDVTAVKNGLATKANTSALQDYYTRSETDDVATTVAAGEVSKYDASLVIGGVNLVTDSNNISQSNNGSTYTVRYEKGNPNKIVNVTNNGGISTYTPKFYPTVIGKTYTVSVKVRPDKDTKLSLYAVSNANGTLVAKSDTSCPANVWTTLWYTFVAKVESVRLAGFQITTGFTDNVIVEYKEYQAEEGSKATSWSPANEDIQQSLDANATAIENTNAEVKKVDGRVTTEANKITALTGRVDTAEKGLALKADTTALNDIYTKTEVDDKAAEIAAGEVSKFSASLKVGTRNYASQFQNGEAFTSYSGSVVKVTPKQSKTLMSVTQPINEPFQLQITGGAAAILTTPLMTMTYSVKATLSFKIKNIGTNDATMNFNGFEPVKYAKGKNRVLPGEEFEVVVFGQMRPNYDWIQFQFRNPTGSAGGSYTDVSVLLADIMFSEGHVHTGWTEPMAVVMDELDVNAKAISTTNSEVSRIDNVVKGHVTDISNLTTSIAGKADTSALNALTVRVEAEELKSSSQATSITSLNSNVADALKAVTISDTRSTNQPPSWYWANYARRTVNEFKTQTAIGVGGFFGGTYCNLETRVYYSDSTGGDIIQTATSSSDTSAYVQRTSSGKGEAAVWTAWKQPIKDLRDELGTKASASAVNTLTTKVTDIEGTVSSQAEQITTLKSDNADNKNTLQVQAKVVDGVKANYMVKMETNGVIGGFGLIQSTGALGQVKTSFGVNANSFFIGPPNSKKQPFLVTTANQVIDGIKYPAGTYINSAIIANATIGTAHIADAAITNAKIGNIDASKITTGTLDAARIRVGSTTQFDAGYKPSDVLESAKTYVDDNTGNFLNNTTLTGTTDKWNSTPTVTSQDFFGKTVPVLTLSGATNLAATSSKFKVDPSKAYEVSFWAKADVAVGTMYFGLYAYNSSGTSVGVMQVTNSTGSEVSSVVTNFYFFTGISSSLPVGEWRKYVAYIMPVGTDAVSMKGIGENVTYNAKFVPDTTALIIRWYNYSTAGQSTKWAANFKCVEVDPNAVIAAAKAQILADSKTKTFTAQPTTPYSKGDIYRNGSSIYVSTTTRLAGNYSAGDWVLVGDVTANNKAADTSKVGGVAAATVVDNASKGLAIYNDVMSDLKITPVEKASLNTEWVRIQAEYNSLLSQSASLAVNTTEFRAAYAALNSTAPTMTSILSSMTTTTTLTATQRDALRTQFTNYYAQVNALNTAINDKIASNAKAYTDAIEIGGANLLYRSYDKDLWIKYGSPTISIASDEYTTAPLLTTKTTFEGTGGTSTLKVYRQLSDLEAGKTITLSATVKNRGTKSITVNTLGLTPQASQVITAGTSSRLVFTGTTAGGNLQFRIATSAAADAFKVDIIDLKIEYGSKATSWTPSTKEVEDLVESKARTFTAQPTIPYSKGDIWKDGATIKVSTTTRTSGSYTAADWVLVGDVTSANTAADSNKLGGTAASTVVNNAAKGLAVYNDVMSDLKITPVEKTSLNTEWTRIKAEYTNMLAHATGLSVSTTSFTTAYNALNSTSPTMTSILSSMSTTTTLTAAQRDALRTQFTNYYAQVTALNKAISDKIAANAKAQADAKSKTFTAQPAPPYTAGDLWKSGSTIRVCTVTRSSGSYVAADWTLVGDVTSANTAANSNQLGGKASSVVLNDITAAKNAADTAAANANSANNQLALWKYPNTTEIDGGKIRTNTVTANQINVSSLSAITANLGTMVSYSNPADIRSARTVIKGDVIEVYDDNNQLRVRLGRW